MQFQLTSIEFNFDNQDLSQSVKDCITEEVKQDSWTSPTESDLITTITDIVGYNIKSITYSVI